MGIFSDVAAIRAKQETLVADVAAIRQTVTTAEQDSEPAWAALARGFTDLLTLQTQTVALLTRLADALAPPPPPPVVGLAVEEHPPTPRP